MSRKKTNLAKEGHRSHRGLSIQYRIPILISSLLFFTILSFTLISFFTARKIALRTGKERLKNLTEQLGTMFGRQAQAMRTISQAIAADTVLIRFLNGNRNTADSSIHTALRKFRSDSTWVIAELLDEKGNSLARSALGERSLPFDRAALIATAVQPEGETMIGKMYHSNDTLFYPIITTIKQVREGPAFLVRWRLQAATPEAIAQFSELLGKGASFYIGNADNSLWSDLNRPVSPPPGNLSDLLLSREYERPGRDWVIGQAKEVPNTPWALLVELSRDTILQPATRSLGILALLGGILLIAGFVIAWILSQRITGPIKQLTRITDAVARGDYSVKVDLHRDDELGRLGEAYSSMLHEVNHAQQIKEEEVRVRTAELKTNLQRLQESEARFRGLLESAPDAMVITDEAGNITLVNKRAESLFGYRRDELVGQPVDLLIPEGERQRYKQYARGFFRQEEITGTGSKIELYALRKDGKQFPVEISLAPLDIESGSLVSADIRDITERKEADEAIRTLNKELESFTYSVSHDLRAPLRIIDGYANIMIEDHGGKLDESGKRTLETIKQSARRMGQLIDDLLNLSHIGRKDLAKTKTDMNGLVKEVVEEQVLLSSKPVAITVDNLPDVRCDEGLIRQVWRNLLGNAIKYSSKKDHPRVIVSASSTAQEVIYKIQDNGVGFDMKYAEKLFGVFQRLHSLSEFEGTGIGLALCNRILTRHGGRIWAEAAPEQGASFYFSIPV